MKLAEQLMDVLNKNKVNEKVIGWTNKRPKFTNVKGNETAVFPIFTSGMSAPTSEAGRDDDDTFLEATLSIIAPLLKHDLYHFYISFGNESYYASIKGHNDANNAKKDLTLFLSAEDIRTDQLGIDWEEL